jgi:putative hydrolase of the HAD superfamily
MKKAVLFDLDNTLYNYDECNKIAMDQVYKVFKKESDIERDDFEHLFADAKAEVKRTLIGTAASHSRVLYFQRLTEKVHNTVTPEQIFELYNAYWDTLISNAKLFDGVIEFLEELKSKGIKVIIVTNLTAFIQMRKIIHLGISDYVDYLVTSEEAGFDKPHPAPYLLALH